MEPIPMRLDLGTSALVEMYDRIIQNLVSTWNSLMGIIQNFINLNSFQAYFASEINVDYANATASLGGFFKDMFDFTKSPAIALAVFFWMFGLFKQVSSFAEMKRPETIFRHLVRFILAMSVIYAGPLIISSIWDIGTSLASSFRSVSVSLDSSSSVLGGINITTFNEAFDKIKNMPTAEVTTDTSIAVEMLTIIIALFGMGIGFFCCFSCAFYIFCGIFKRWFMMGIFVVISPLALSTVSYEGTQRTALQFCKATAATTFELTLTVLVLKMFSVFTGTMLSNGIFVEGFKLDVIPISSELSLQISAIVLFCFCTGVLTVIIRSLNAMLDSLFGLRSV